MAAQNYHSVAIILNFSVLPLGLFLLSRLLPLIIKPLWNWRQLWLHLLALILLAQKEKEGGSWQCIRHSALAHYSCAVFWGTILRILSILQYFGALFFIFWVFCSILGRCSAYSAVFWGANLCILQYFWALFCVFCSILGRYSAYSEYSAVFWGTILHILSILQYFGALFCVFCSILGR